MADSPSSERCDDGVREGVNSLNNVIRDEKELNKVREEGDDIDIDNNNTVMGWEGLESGVKGIETLACLVHGGIIDIFCCNLPAH